MAQSTNAQTDNVRTYMYVYITKSSKRTHYTTN